MRFDPTRLPTRGMTGIRPKPAIQISDGVLGRFWSSGSSRGDGKR